jgi:glycosyltransferase involved in cell wall biosynthesis
MILGQAHDVGQTAGGVQGSWVPNPDNWEVVPLGCDPPDLSKAEKMPGRVVYCSSPDRGLHLLLQEWPAIKRAVPHATLKIFYRLAPWLEQWHGVHYYPPIERQRARAHYIEEALRRMPDHGIEVCDSVSRNQIQREMLAAEVMAYPCDTVRWTEGFSCSLLEGCAAQACPVTTDVDALGEIYGGVIPTLPKGEIGQWRETVIRALQDSKFRAEVNNQARSFAEKLTWEETARTLASLLTDRLSRLPAGPASSL